MTHCKKSLILMGMLIIFLLTSSVWAITGSMGNARMILYPEVNGWTTTTIEKSILVKNVNDEEIKITLVPDIDGEFTLQPGTEKKAQFLVKVRKEGKYEGRINVFFSPLNEEGAGVALSSTVIVIARKNQDYEDIEEDIEEEIDEESTPITGGSIGTTEEKNNGLTFLIGSSVFLLLVLIVLIFLMKNKSKKQNIKKRKVRRKKI